MTKPKVALVATHKADIEVYLKHLVKHDVEIQVVASLKQLENFLSSEPYNGIIVDLKTKLSLPRGQKELAYELLEHYPVLQSRIIPNSNRLQIMPFGKAQNDVSLETFLREECLGFAARKIRSSIRRKIHFNILLSRNGSFSMQDLERTITLNVSRDGCFIVTPSKWPEHASVPFIIKELELKTPIVGEIRWSIPWGQGMQVPGIGIKFEDIQPSQQQELVEKYDLAGTPGPAHIAPRPTDSEQD